MSATPIPRTLQMSMAGVRDISVIETPPEGRRPIKTFVGEYDEELVKRALLREKERHGQAFFLHNRVETIEETAVRLRGLCPGMRFLVAHGQMDEGTLEERMMAFLRGDADVLVCTSIIESGIDIPQANTLIVERSDQFGLSQLYQIRGRVGRSRERAYAYLLYPSAAALTHEAAQRLSALSDYTELGAGFKIAMRDLELRGAGNLLGDEQSGHVAALGFELYMQMLDEAVAAAGGDGSDPDDDWEPVRLDVSVDAYVPADYIPYEQAKVDVHRRIAGAREVADLMALREELADRFGELPEPLENLILLQQARIKLGQAGAQAVTVRGRSAGGDADRAGLGQGQGDPRSDPRGAVRIGQVAAVGSDPQGPGAAVPGDRPRGRRAAGRDPRGGARAGRGRARRRRTKRSHKTLRFRRRAAGICRYHRLAMKTLRSFPALCAFFVVAALIVAGCGSSSSSSSSDAGSVPSTDAAVVAGNPITKRAVLHWMYVDAKGQAAQSPGAPVIVPTDPPEFPKCIAQVKKQIPTLAKESDAKIRAACQSAFTSYSPGGHGLPDHGLLVSGTGPQAGDQPDRRAAAAGDHQGQDPDRGSRPPPRTRRS